MRKLTSLAYIGILAGLLLTGCNDPTSEVSSTSDEISEDIFKPDEVVLGEQYEPSWNVESMRTFYSAMSEAFPSARMLSAEEAIQVTHSYMRFLPQNREEYDTLQGSGIDMYPYPLDYTLEQGGDAYTADGDADSIIWQYAVVSKDLLFPNYIQHEILQETYMPLLVEEEASANGRTAKVMLDDGVSAAEFLEMCALLDNNLLDSALRAMNLFDSLYYDASDEEAVSGRLARRKWRFRLKSPLKAVAQVVKTVRNTVSSIRILKWGANGRVLVEYHHPKTDSKVREGVANIEVVARQGLLNRRTFTRSDGSYVFEFPAFAPVLYQLRFQNNYVTVRQPYGFLTATKFRRLKALNKGWNPILGDEDKLTKSWACVMIAVNDYYNVLPFSNDEAEVAAPPKGLKIRVPNSKITNFPLGSLRGLAHVVNQTITDLGFIYFNPATVDILIGKIGSENTSAYKYDGVYASTIHELGHLAHWNRLGWTAIGSGVKLLRTESIVRETWADAVMQFAYRKKFFPNMSLVNSANTPDSSIVHGGIGPWAYNQQQCDVNGEEYIGTLALTFGMILIKTVKAWLIKLVEYPLGVSTQH